MWYWLLLMSFVCAVDDVFTDIPSQFGGYNYSIGTGMTAQVDDVKYQTYTLRGTTDPRLNLSVFYQTERDLLLSGRGFILSFGGKEHTIFEQANANKMSVKYPVSLAIALRKGIVLNPSTLFAIDLGIGGEKVTYRYVTETKNDLYAFILGGVSIVTGVLNKWGIEIGLDARALGASEALLNVVNEYYHPQYVVNGRIGLVLHHEKEIE